MDRRVWACVLLALLHGSVHGVVDVSNDNALAPPLRSVEDSRVLRPKGARGSPVQGQRLVVASPEPSPSPIVVLPQEVDLSTTVVGEAVMHRQYLDYATDLELVIPAIRFPGAGHVQQWEVYAGRDCELEVQVLRQGKVPARLAHNDAPLNLFTIVGTNVLQIPELGHHTFEVPLRDQIKVKEGDTIGLFTKQPGCVSWSSGGSKALFRYGMPTQHELDQNKGILFVGEGVYRSYSVACSGNFTYPALEMKKRTSPTSTPSITPSASPASPSPSRTISLSTTPSDSPSTSVSASASPSYSPTPSRTPSVTPTVFSGKSDCSLGVMFWCKTPHNMKMCNVTEEICAKILDAIYPPLPSTFPSHTPSVSPSTSFTPTMQAPLPSPPPSFTPSTSLVPPPYEVAIPTPLPSGEPAAADPGVGLDGCNYCNGGADWTAGQCATGTRQSPITIKFEEMDVEPALSLYFAVNYNITRAQLAWNNWAFTLSAPDFGRINIDGQNYVADMATIHAPSEHKLEGARTPMEIQIFHRVANSNPPRVIAVAVLFEATAEPVPELDWIFQIPEDKSPMEVMVDLESFLSDQKPLAFYNGSMTTPPCQEGVTWAVSMGKSARISFQQVVALNKHLKDKFSFARGRGNNRMTQPMNGRRVLLRSNCGISGAMECGGDAPASAANLPAKQGGSAEGVDRAIAAESSKLSAAAVREAELAAEDVGGDEGGMFEDGDVKLW